MVVLFFSHNAFVENLQDRHAKINKLNLSNPHQLMYKSTLISEGFLGVVQVEIFPTVSKTNVV